MQTSLPPDNPGQADPVVVGIADNTSSDRDYTPLVHEAFEYYIHYEITVFGIDHAVGWYVGYWLGRVMGATDWSELAPPFQDAGYEDRRSSW